MNPHRCLTPTGVTLRPYRSSDLHQIVQIANEQLGEGYLTASSITGRTENMSTFILTSPPRHEYGEPITLIAACQETLTLPDGEEMPRETIIGFAHGYIQPPGAAESLMGVSLPSYLAQQRLIGCIKTTGVRDIHQRRDVKSALVHKMIDAFRERGIHVAYGITRQAPRSEQSDLAQIMRQHDFAVFARIPGYWSEASKKGGLVCPNCPTPPCQCTTVAYGRRL